MVSSWPLIHISEKLNGLDASIVHTQHDEIIVEARDGIEDQVEAIVKESMEEAFQGITQRSLLWRYASVCSVDSMDWPG